MLCQPVISLSLSLCLWHMQMGENTINLAKQAGRVGLQRRLWLNRYGMKTETANDNKSETERECQFKFNCDLNAYTMHDC